MRVRQNMMKNTGVDVIGIKVTKIAEGKFNHKIVSETKFASYELVPNDIQGKLIAEHEAELAKEAE